MQTITVNENLTSLAESLEGTSKLLTTCKKSISNIKELLDMDRAFEGQARSEMDLFIDKLADLMDFLILHYTFLALYVRRAYKEMVISSGFIRSMYEKMG